MDFFVKITLQQWRRINSLISAAEQALKAADDEILKVVFEHHDQGNEAEVLLLMDLSRKINETGPSGWGYMTHPQTEWTGGDSSDPANFTLREPNIINMGKRFPRDQVEEERQKKVE